MENGRQQREREIDLLDLVLVLLKRKRLIACVTVGAAVLAAVFSLLLPPVYRAETKILPPQRGNTGMASQIINQFGTAAGLFGAALPVKPPGELYVGMLQARTVVDRIIDRFGLIEAYGMKFREGARKKILEKVLSAEMEKKSGIIVVTVEDRDPKRAAEMANAFVEELKLLTGGLAVTEAAQRRLFFEEQLGKTKVALTRSEDAVKGFQEQTGALQIDAQAKAMIEGIAKLRAAIAAKEVELRVFQSYATPQNPDLQRVEEERRGLLSELRKLEASSGKGYDPLMPTGRMPAVGTEYLRKLRDLKFNEALYELLLKQYEIAKLDEVINAAVIQVIDRAIPPERKAKPRRALIVLLAAVTGLFLSLVIAFAGEFADRSRSDPEYASKLDRLSQYGRIFK